MTLTVSETGTFSLKLETHHSNEAHLDGIFNCYANKVDVRFTVNGPAAKSLPCITSAACVEL